MLKKWTIRVLAAAFVLSLSACGGKTAPPPAATPAPGAGGGAAQVNSEAIYKQNCLSCHGGNLEGVSGPGLSKVGGKLSKDQIAAKIAAGGGGMPAFKTRLKEDEIQGLADWLAAKK